ncbi:MAG: M23 family metallopeptidase [Chitinophagales bacterium]|nr:M23 family metallopeptidase [Chitinophagales bacterium]MDW8272901.1 M23 family metallopeptidase [Chitinophagales bacterium]
MSPRKKTSRNTNLRNKYRFVVLNDETFEEKFALTLTRRNVFIFLSTVAVTLVALTSAVIIYTPLKYFIPGFGDYNYRSQIIQLQFKTDSLEKALKDRELWLNNVSNVISGNIDTTIPKAPPKKETISEKSLREPSDAEKELRRIVEEEESFSLSYNATAVNEELEEMKQLHFILPVNGYVTDDFNVSDGHYALDIVTAKDEPVKALYDGTVVSAHYSMEFGYTIVLQHKDNLVSIYKHLSKLLKKTGNFVKAGEVIGLIGNTGELSNGPHLHLEIWKNGKPVNPKLILPY